MVRQIEMSGAKWICVHGRTPKQRSGDSVNFEAVKTVKQVLKIPVVHNGNVFSLDDVKKRASVYLKPDQVSLAIGKGGFNIKLASKLTGYEIDVFRDTDTEVEDDVDLDEFSDEIDGWVIDEFKKIGCDTAKSVLELDRDELVRRTDLEEETVDDVLRILKSEFE